MRIPFPKSIPLRQLTVFLTVMLFIQLAQGTDPLFAVLMLVAQLAAVAAFNRLGGMTHMAGAFCLLAMLPNVTVPEFTHLVLGQPGDFNLEHPIMTSGVCAAFFCCIFATAVLVSLTKPTEPILDRIPFSSLELRVISAVSAAFAIVVAFVVTRAMSTTGVENGSLIAALYQFLPFTQAISVILATYVRLRTTNNQSCMSWYVGLMLLIMVIPGVLNAQKEGMLTPIFCWLVVVAASGHRLSRVGILALVALVLFLWSFVYPFSQNARFPIREAETLSEKVDLIIQYIQDPSSFPDSTSNSEESSEFGTDTSKVNIVQRYSLLKSIDMLIDADLRSGYTSIDRYLPVLVSVVPHVFWPDRPQVITSNELGHKAGFAMADSDTITGIAIGSPALFFDIGGWLALLVYTPICFALFFLVAVRLVGKTTVGPWALVPIGMEAHSSSASSPAAMFTFVITFLTILLIAVALLKTASYITQTLLVRPVSSGA